MSVRAPFAAATALDRSLPHHFLSGLLSAPRISSVVSFALLSASYLVVARSCGYDHASLLLYLAYVGLYVGLPGCLLLNAAQGRWPTVLEAFAIGLPLGFAMEIGLFFLASATHLKSVLPFSPALWLVLGSVKGMRTRSSLYPAEDLGGATPSYRCTVALLIFAFAVTIVSQFYVCAPLVNGVLGTTTNHDWIYLLSRAGEIKQRWPLEDPSFAGAPLRYHYFLLVHLASASFVTDMKLELIGLRLCVLPLSAALMAQALWLGKTLTRNIWGGVIATGLLLVANELSFQNPSAGSNFANEFVRWLFISPTFFFGMIFTGALMVWIYRLLAADRLNWLGAVILGMLAAAGTGAKGTVVPPLLLALLFWWIIEAARTRRFPVKTAVLLGILSAGFSVVYFSILSTWGTGAAAISPLFTIKLSRFWQEHADAWTTLLESWGLPSGFSLSLAHVACVSAVLVGFSGIRLLGLLTVGRWKDQPNRKLTCWLGLAAAMYCAFGHFLVLDCNSQFYLLFPLRLPEAVLAAAAILWIISRVKVNVADFAGMIAVYGRRVALLSFIMLIAVLFAAEVVSWWMALVLGSIAALIFAPTNQARTTFELVQFGRFAWRVSPLLGIAAVTLIQVNHWRMSNEQGFKLWMTQSSVTANQDVILLREGMDWIRTHTPPDSVFVANAFSEKNLCPGALALIDNTTVDKYYYYSALAERRFWVEGPTYLLDQYAAARRIATASQVFAGGPVSLFFAENKAPDYIVIDHSLNDGAIVDLPREHCVFENPRITVYRLIAPGSLPKEQIAAVVP